MEDEFEPICIPVTESEELKQETEIEHFVHLRFENSVTRTNLLFQQSQLYCSCYFNRLKVSMWVEILHLFSIVSIYYPIVIHCSNKKLHHTSTALSVMVSLRFSDRQAHLCRSRDRCLVLTLSMSRTAF